MVVLLLGELTQINAIGLIILFTNLAAIFIYHKCDLWTQCLFDFVPICRDRLQITMKTHGVHQETLMMSLSEV